MKKSIIHLFLTFPLLASGSHYEFQEGVYRGLKLGFDVKIEACEVTVKKSSEKQLTISFGEKGIQTLYKEDDDESQYLFKNELGYKIFKYTDGPALRDPTKVWDCVRLKPINLDKPRLDIDDGDRAATKENEISEPEKSRASSALQLN